MAAADALDRAPRGAEGGLIRPARAKKNAGIRRRFRVQVLKRYFFGASAGGAAAGAGAGAELRGACGGLGGVVGRIGSRLGGVGGRVGGLLGGVGGLGGGVLGGSFGLGGGFLAAVTTGGEGHGEHGRCEQRGDAVFHFQVS